MIQLRYLMVFTLAVLLLGGGCSKPVERDEKVGRQHRAYVDEDRSNWKGDAPRPIAATIWYPAAADALESDWRIGVFRFGRNALNADFADTQKRPLIVLSHGTGGSGAQLSWLAESLVSAGFIVAGVNHHGNTAAEERPSPPGFVLPGERAQDLTVLIDQLLTDPEFAPRIDPARIGAAGFSLGGYSVLATAGPHLEVSGWLAQCQDEPDRQVCQLPPEAGFSIDDVLAMAETSSAFKAGIVRAQQPKSDSRIRAVYAIAPALVGAFEDIDLSSIDVPVRVVLAEHDAQIELSTTASRFTHALPEAELLVLPDAGHYVFLAPCNLRGRLTLRALCTDPGQVKRQEIHRHVGQDAKVFFIEHL